MASQLFFEYLRSRLKDDEKDLKGALTVSGYVQWIDTLECVFHDSTASLNWVSIADKAFLKKSIFDVWKRQKSIDVQTNFNQTFVPTVVCIIPDEQSQLIFRRHGQSHLKNHASFFRHNLRVGVIAESHLKKKPSLLEQIFSLKPFFELPKNLKRPPPIDLLGNMDPNADPDLNFKLLFGSGKIFEIWKKTNTKTFAIIPAIPVAFQKTWQFLIDAGGGGGGGGGVATTTAIISPDPSIPTLISDDLAKFLKKSSGSVMARIDVIREINARYMENKRDVDLGEELRNFLKLKDGDVLTQFNLQRFLSPHFFYPDRNQDFLDALLDYYNLTEVELRKHGKHFLVIVLKDLTGRQAMACLDWADIDAICDIHGRADIHLKNCTFEGQTLGQMHSSWSVFSYAIFSTDLLLDSNHSFEFAKCLCVSSRPHEALPKEQLRTIVKQGHSFSDKLSFGITSSHALRAFSKVRDKYSHESIIYKRDQQPLDFVYSPWVSRPAFPRPTMGSPFFLLFLMSNRGYNKGAHSSTGEYTLDVRKETCDNFSKALSQLGSALQEIRNSSVSNLDSTLIKKPSYLLFQWHKFIDAMPWIGRGNLKHIPPRVVLFRTRVCASALR